MVIIIIIMGPFRLADKHSRALLPVYLFGGLITNTNNNRFFGCVLRSAWSDRVAVLGSLL